MLPQEEEAPQYDPAETAAWYWLAHESGLGLRRAKRVLFDHILGRSLTLREVLAVGPAAWEGLLGLTPAEVQILAKQIDRRDEIAARLAAWTLQGVGVLRLNELAFPATLNTHLPAEERPLLLAYRGDADLLEMPGVLALAGDPPDEAAIAWTQATLLELTDEGALPLAVARAGIDAAVARSQLAAEAPLALIVVQGLAAYTPPPALQAAVAAGRSLLLSPFRPDAAASSGDNPLLPHAASFAQALAQALLIITPPHPTHLTPEQPCFLRPGLPKTVGCQSYYAGAEDFFLRLTEAPAEAAAVNTAPQPPFSAPAAPLPPAPPLDPEMLIERLAQLGNVPEAMKAKLRETRR